MRAMCKINIGLDITGRREDGYHEIRTLMHTVSLFDELRFSPSEDLVVNCPGIPQEENIVTSAVRRTLEYGGIKGGMKVDIVKNIPSRAGLGGGSTDAACAIRAASMMFGMGLSPDEMREIALGAGADVPFLIDGGCALCEGIGEMISPAGGSYRWPVLIVMPPSLRVDTGEAYRRMDSLPPKPAQDFSKVFELLSTGEPVASPQNAFEAYVGEISPESLGIRDSLISLGAFAAGLSGSGAAFYGLFRDLSSLDAAEAGMKKYTDTVIKSCLCGSSYSIISKSV